MPDRDEESSRPRALLFPPPPSPGRPSTRPVRQRAKSRRWCSVPWPASLAIPPRTKIPAEKRHHVVLKPVRHRAGVRAGINLEGVRDAVLVEHIMQLRGVRSQPVLIAHVDPDGFVLPQISDVLIDERQRRIRG